MTRAEIKKLETIIGKVETLQGQTRDDVAKDRLQTAKSYLIRCLQECSQ